MAPVMRSLSRLLLLLALPMAAGVPYAAWACEEAACACCADARECHCPGHETCASLERVAPDAAGTDLPAPLFLALPPLPGAPFQDVRPAETHRAAPRIEPGWDPGSGGFPLPLRL